MTPATQTALLALLERIASALERAHPIPDPDRQSAENDRTRDAMNNYSRTPAAPCRPAMPDWLPMPDWIAR